MKSREKGISKYVKVILAIILMVVISGASFYVGNIVATQGYVISGGGMNSIGDLDKVGNTDIYSNLFGLRSLLLAKYDGEIEDEVLLEGAMKGMAEALGDPYTVYMDKEEFDVFMESSQGSFYGIGAQIGVKDEKVRIIAPIEGSAAQKAGLLADDVILKVDDYVVNDLNTDAVVSRVRGDLGEPVVLTIQRKEGEPFEVKIIREEIETVSVEGEMLDDTLGYIQISTFSDEEVSEKFTNQLNELKDKGMKKLILDLRGNPGGYLDQCIDIASHFIDQGEVVTYTIDKYDNKVVSESKGGDASGMPLVVLVDGGSASASEVVTGALRDHDAATIVGTNTFGKGIVQQLLQLSNEMGGLKVTTSRYYTPNGENIHGTGIAPDIEVELTQEVLDQEYSREIDPQFQKALEVIKEMTE